MRTLAAALALMACVPLACAQEPPRERWRDDGLAAYERGHDAEALSCFRRAAEAGDARSAEMLALMYRFGPRLYSVGVPADTAEAAKWAAVAAEARRREAAAPMAAR